MDELFHVSERKSTIRTELRAGLTTFLAMAYIIAVNPAVLSGAGIDAGALACATCLGAGIMTICMGIFANRPLACASGLGVNAMIAGITTTVCGGDWHVAMSVIFLEGVVILLLVLCGLREAIMDAIPVVLRHAISVGLGLFIAMIGLCDAGIITAGAGTLVGLGDITSPTFIVGIISIVVTVALASRNVPGSHEQRERDDEERGVGKDLDDGGHAAGIGDGATDAREVERGDDTGRSLGHT